MPRSFIAGIGMYVPEHVFTNADMTKYMDTSDEWIQERTGIKERRFADRTNETTATMGVEAAKQAIERAGITVDDVDFIIFATLSPDYYFPGCGVLVQRALQMKDIGALDVRNQCSGFIYAISVGDQFIRSGMYKNILVIGSEKHSFGIDFDTRSRNVTVIFGDGAGAVILQPTEDADRGILSTHLHSDGNDAEILAMFNPGSHANHWKDGLADYDSAEIGEMFVSHAMIDKHQNVPFMDGKRCAGGTNVRLATKPHATGSTSYPQFGDQPVHIKGFVPPAGGVRTYQVWYRNNLGPCGTGSNLSNGVSVIWVP